MSLLSAWCSSLCPVLSCFFISLCFQELPGGAMAHCLDPVYLGLISDPTLSPCAPVLEKLFYGKRLASHLVPQVQMYFQHLLGRHLIVNLRSDLPSLNKWALNSNEEGSKESSRDSKQCHWSSWVGVGHQNEGPGSLFIISCHQTLVAKMYSFPFHARS